MRCRVTCFQQSSEWTEHGEVSCWTAFRSLVSTDVKLLDSYWWALKKVVHYHPVLTALLLTSAFRFSGLYLTDLVPTLASGALQTQASSISDAIILQLWSGLGVLQLNVYIEEGPYPQSGMRGVVFALVRQSVDFHSEIRMWSLQTLINLAKYRCSSEVSSRFYSVRLVGIGI